MHRLIENRLRFGGLFRVDQAHLIERYNAALEAICGRRTELEAFDLDAMGYSPQLAEEFEDEDYLDRHGINPHFILISTKQRNLPVVRGWFSAYEAIMKAFWDANFASLFTLTTLTAVQGMIQNNTYRVNAPEDLLAINTVRFELDTPDDLIDTAGALERNIDKFVTVSDAWLDDGLVEEMCDQARLVGDIRRQPLVPSELVFEKGHFYTQHFGGLYVFRIDGGYSLFSLDPAFEPPKSVSGSDVVHISMQNRDDVFKFLRDHDLVEQIGATSSRERTAEADLRFLERRRDMMVLLHMADMGVVDDYATIDETDLRRHLVEHAEAMPAEVSSLVLAIKQLESGRRFWVWDVPRAHRSYFLRARKGVFEDLVNQMLSHHCELDPLFLFATNKPLFYSLYETWPESRKSILVGYIKQHWLENRTGTAAILFE
ncbi:DUF6638 family protein [Aestuariispira insulae]|uniref:Uncharacterized protein n=1 Tax=Aestuariispira insulae TaxID=1461337 RepID=A0A3D9HXE7_9PROT|nr:DUF6638 family protein [Aestuariispira insulae]RED54178.1 hypothetical protein DFP90_101981 [Aestuariispira insulae]